MKRSLLILALCLAGCASQSTPTVLHYVALDWNASIGGGTDANGNPMTVVGYNVYRGPGISGPFTKLTSQPINALDYNDSAIASGQSYAYYVTAVDNLAQESDPSNKVTCTIP